MDFLTDVFSLRAPSNVKFNLVGTKIPNSNDIFFRAKQEELVEQYSVARIFMHETETDDWNHWFSPVEDEVINESFQLTLKSHFYEIALFYYNAVVDISWTLCYAAAEFACSAKGVRVDISGIKPIEEAFQLFRIVENNVTSPTAEENPFSYLKKMCPEFEPAINQIINFWNTFSSSEIRKRYNYCKHKGRPSYEEIETLSPGKIMNVYLVNKNTGYACFSGMWWVPQNKLAYMEPLCTVPKYRKMGLAAAALTQHYRRLKPLGAECMTGGGNDFYKRIGYDDGIHWLHYKKREI